MAYMKDLTGRRLDTFRVAPVDAVASSRRLAVTNNCYGTAAQLPGVQTTAGTSRVPHLVGVTATDLQVVVGNHYTDPGAGTFYDVAAANPIAIRAALEINSVVYPLTFGGKRDVTIDGGGLAVSDRLPVTVTKGDVIHSRIYTSSTSWWANKRSPFSNGSSGGFTATTDLTNSGDVAVTDAIAWQIAPMAIIGTVAEGPATIIFGDSLAHGYADGSDNNGFAGHTPTDLVRGGGGFVVRGLSGHSGIVNVAVSSDRGQLFFNPAAHWKRMQFAQYASAAVIEYGRNDASALTSYLSIGTYITAIARWCKQRGLRTIVTTVTPRTSSTDNWFTAGNQAHNTSAMEAIRVQYNTWLRAGAPVDASTLTAVAVGTSGALLRGDADHPMDVLWDVTLLAETSQDSGIWRGAERIVLDAAISSGSGALSSTSAAFTSEDVGKAVAVVGAGSGGAVLQSVIRSVASGVATLNSAAGTTVSGASCGVGVITFDGVHANQYGALLLSAAVDPDDL